MSVIDEEEAKITEGRIVNVRQEQPEAGFLLPPGPTPFEATLRELEGTRRVMIELQKMNAALSGEVAQLRAVVAEYAEKFGN